eukprot:scaffold3586_cov404-Prasinococcus_capsulatus_cf.AAC.23
MEEAKGSLQHAFTDLGKKYSQERELRVALAVSLATVMQDLLSWHHDRDQLHERSKETGLYANRIMEELRIQHANVTLVSALRKTSFTCMTAN